MNRELYLEWIDLNRLDSDQLKDLDELDLLISESKKSFLKWCNKIRVPKRLESYNPLIIEYQHELEYRKKRDEEYQFDDVLEDNASFRLFDHTFAFQMREMKVKRRSLFSNDSSGHATMEFRPMYERIFNGMFEIEVTEKLDYRDLDKDPGKFVFMESREKPIEEQMGEIFVALLRAANKTRITRIISEREYELLRQEKKQQQKIEEEKRRAVQRIEEQNRRMQELTQNIEKHMERWYAAQKLKKYAKELEAFASKLNDETKKRRLYAYIKLVGQKVEDFDPVTDMLNEMAAIEELKS